MGQIAETTLPVVQLLPGQWFSYINLYLSPLIFTVLQEQEEEDLVEEDDGSLLFASTS